jgi:hypothetical protein
MIAGGKYPSDEFFLSLTDHYIQALFLGVVSVFFLNYKCGDEPNKSIDYKDERWNNLLVKITN